MINEVNTYRLKLTELINMLSINKTAEKIKSTC